MQKDSRCFQINSTEHLLPLSEHGLNAGVAVPEQTKVRLKKKLSLLSITNKKSIKKDKIKAINSSLNIIVLPVCPLYIKVLERKSVAINSKSEPIDIDLLPTSAQNNSAWF